ncbi:MAG TPA: bifunctional diaminohydroxyphosphoribosylaminopyrimidine deaminase/5-amino-6-(5-phosphoribosylamino)uracil reductase RibD [Longimicrobiales bacterium]|nr:bifunctional diaminohydroxyphosphoribosylaminopyrimidine deaminase/5-amino-6-(5-phosphoribosylamino)uracil reductase RibD [Longimicrobiales bacterium]
MRRALELARRGRVGTHPNPMVGAVLVRDGIVVGEGFHALFGGPHAEVAALEAAGDAARGATLYVTLEPCAHHGKTPPCVDAIIAAGVATVVIGGPDPSVKAGGGAKRLREAGIAVVTDVEADRARTLNAPFYRVHERGAPFLALKLALSLDGCIAAAAGSRTAITGPEANMETHRLRASHDAVLVGIGTARVDDPLLTVRGVDVRRQPARVVADSDASLSPESNLVRTAGEAPLIVACADDAAPDRMARLEAAGARLLPVPRSATGTGIDLAALLRDLAGDGMNAVLAEGGAVLGTGLLAAGLVDRLYIFMAPSFVGDGVRAFGTVAASTAWTFADVERFGADVLLTLDPAAWPVEHT